MRTYGYFIGAALGAILYNTAVWGWGLSISQIFMLNGLVPLFSVVPLLWSVEELSDPSEAVPTLVSQLEDMWSTLQNSAVQKTILFIYLYNVCQVNNAPWMNFLIYGDTIFIPSSPQLVTVS